MMIDSTDNGDSSYPGSSLTATVRTMGVFGAISILFRWLPVIIPMLAVTAYTAISATDEIQPEYTATGAILLIGPNEVYITDLETDEVTVQEVNPLSALGGSLSTVARVTALAMEDGAVVDQVDAEGLSADFEVAVQSRSPILEVVAVANDAEVAGATVDRIIDLMAEDLDSRQDDLDAPETERYRSQRIGESTTGPPDFGGRNRVRIAIVAIGLILATATAFLLEAAVQYYRFRRRPHPAGGPAIVYPPVKQLEVGDSRSLVSGQPKGKTFSSEDEPDVAETGSARRARTGTEGFGGVAGEHEPAPDEQADVPWPPAVRGQGSNQVNGASQELGADQTQALDDLISSVKRPGRASKAGVPPVNGRPANGFVIVENDGRQDSESVDDEGFGQGSAVSATAGDEKEEKSVVGPGSDQSPTNEPGRSGSTDANDASDSEWSTRTIEIPPDQLEQLRPPRRT